MSDYPGQEFFHAHNANIRRAEQNWSAAMTPLQERAREQLREVIAVKHYKVEVDPDGDTLCKCGQWFLNIQPGSFEKHLVDALLPLLTRVQDEARLEEAKWWDSHSEPTADSNADLQEERLRTLEQAAGQAKGGGGDG